MFEIVPPLLYISDVGSCLVLYLWDRKSFERNNCKYSKTPLYQIGYSLSLWCNIWLVYVAQQCSSPDEFCVVSVEEGVVTVLIFWVLSYDGKITITDWLFRHVINSCPVAKSRKVSSLKSYNYYVVWCSIFGCCADLTCCSLNNAALELKIKRKIINFDKQWTPSISGSQIFSRFHIPNSDLAHILGFFMPN